MRSPRTKFETYHVELLVSSLDIDRHILHIIIYPIEHGPLIDNHTLKLLEDICELDDALSDIVDFSFTLCNRNVIRIQALERGLLKRRLGEGFVSLGLHHRRIIVGVLRMNGGVVEWYSQAAKRTYFCPGLAMVVCGFLVIPYSLDNYSAFS